MNFDQLNAIDDMDQRLRAFIRLGYDVDFSNRKHDFVPKLKCLLGRPYIEFYSWSSRGYRYLEQTTREPNRYHAIYHNVNVDDNSSTNTTLPLDSIRMMVPYQQDVIFNALCVVHLTLSNLVLFTNIQFISLHNKSINSY